MVPNQSDKPVSDQTDIVIRIAFLTPIPLWIIGTVFILIERKRTRIRMGLDPERRR